MFAKRLALFATVMTLLSVAFWGHAGPRARGGWELLGEKVVTDRLDRDIVVVTGAEGRFRAIRIEVRDRPVQFHKVIVNFGDGTSHEVALRRVIRAGGQSRRVDLPGAARVIRTIEFVYDAQSLGGSARVLVFGT